MRINLAAVMPELELPPRHRLAAVFEEDPDNDTQTVNVANRLANISKSTKQHVPSPTQ